MTIYKRDVEEYKAVNENLRKMLRKQADIIKEKDKQIKELEKEKSHLRGLLRSKKNLNN